MWLWNSQKNYHNLPYAIWKTRNTISLRPENWGNWWRKSWSEPENLKSRNSDIWVQKMAASALVEWVNLHFLHLFLIQTLTDWRMPTHSGESISSLGLLIQMLTTSRNNFTDTLRKKCFQSYLGILWPSHADT